MEYEKFISRLEGVKRIGEKCLAKCPGHDDQNSSLSVSKGDDGRILIKCFAGCTAEHIVESMDLRMKDLFPEKKGGEGQHPPEQHCNPATDNISGCTLKEYADLKQIPEKYLCATLQLSQVTYMNKPAVRMPYLDIDGTEKAVQFRINVNGENKFRWRKGDKGILYGLPLIKKKDYAVVVEGPSCTQTLFYKGFQALGVPGASSLKPEFVSYLNEFEKLYVVIEPDKGGQTFEKSFCESGIKDDKIFFIYMGKSKDTSELYLSNPDNFIENFQNAIDNAIPWIEIKKKQEEKQNAEAWEKCKELAQSDNILDRFSSTIPKVGIVGETKLLKIIFLALISRHFNKPISIVVKGPSSGGKSYSVECVLKFFPENAFYSITSMSEHALAYSTEPLKNRYLIIYEASGLNSDLATYLIRSLLSEGCIRYETVIKTSEGMEPKLIEREGPTGLILTTTANKLHPENETRMISITVCDTPDQTSAILKQLAIDVNEEPDLSKWIALQEWISTGEHSVIIPYAEKLASLIPPVAVRLRRDFSSVLSLIKANTLLHRATRERDNCGRIIATLTDYEIVRDLAAEFIAEGVGVLVPDSLRETVQAVKDLNQETVSVKEVAAKLGLDKSAASRRVRSALSGGYLINAEEKRGKALKLEIGDPLPEEIEFLPSVDKLNGCTVAKPQKQTIDDKSNSNNKIESGCTVAVMQEGVKTPPSPHLHMYRKNNNEVKPVIGSNLDIPGIEI